MINETLQQYLYELLPEETDQVSRVKEEALQMKIPIMEDASLHLLTVLLRLQQAKRVLEIGTGIGYSAIKMASAIPNSQILSIERDDIRYETAVKMINQSPFKENIQVIHGDALEVLASYRDAPFDFIYIDAAKSQYQKFFQLAEAHIQPKGMIITDNVLFRGYVVNSTDIPKRFQSMVARLQAYNEWLVNHPDYETSIVPIGDGIAVSVRK